MTSEETNEDLIKPNEPDFKVGDKVEIKNKFDGDWSSGYIISTITTSQTGETLFFVKRASEDIEISQHFFLDHIRKSKKKNMWWI